MFHFPLVTAAAGDSSLAAAPLAALAADVLAAAGAAFLGVSLEPARGGLAARISLWSSALAPMPDPAETPALEPLAAVLNAIELAAEALAGRVLPGSTGGLAGACLGFVTDGTGVGFSPDDAEPLGPGWLERQLAGRARMTVVMPFGARGAWTLLTAARDRAH